MHYDVVIIGAGMSGLAAGIRCAHYGKRVLILEKHTVFGGLNSFYKKGGHHFDVGLHALTNWIPPGYKGPRVPMQRVLRQPRIRADELSLLPQTRSSVRFDDATLVFDNDIDRLTQSVGEAFPAERDRWSRLLDVVRGYPDSFDDRELPSARAVLGELLQDPLLIEMILCPCLYYGSATERDVDFDAFRVLFNSLFFEGFCQPDGGIRPLLKLLVRRYAELGGEMRRGCGVEEITVVGDRVVGLEVEKGPTVTADAILSSAGLVETERLRSDRASTPSQADARVGQLGFVENLWVLDRDPKSLGFEDCVTFFNRGERFAWRRPDETVDLSSGVVCVPSNYQRGEVARSFVVRATHLADHRQWFGFDEETYRAEKTRWADASAGVVAGYGGAFTDHVRYFDGFTPRTVHHYTRHLNGAIYGSPVKVRSGRTDLANLFLCGTDQGLVGVVGAMLSGINMANMHALQGG